MRGDGIIDRVRHRLPLSSASRNGTPRRSRLIAWCLELHDLWIAKAIAGREKDGEFCRALIDRGNVHAPVLRERLAHVLVIDERAKVRR